MRKLAAILFLATLVLSGCYVRSKKYWRTEEAKMECCRADWTYLNLIEKQEVTILLFRRKVDFYRIYPAFIIGVTKDQDTVAVIDKDFDTTLRTRQTITVSPVNWTSEEKEELKPVFSVYPRSKSNDLHCTVKRVYFARFEFP